MRQRHRFTLVAGLAIAGIGCGTAFNYTSPEGPRYSGGFLPRPARDTVSSVSSGPRPDARGLRLVTFNIQFARHVDSAIALLGSAAPLRQADVITLQEMDPEGTSRIAQALGMSYVYYPATVHPKTGRDFGNAILSRWPIIADAKIVLPHLARFGHTERIAAAATILVGDAPVRVYSVHLATFVSEGPRARRDQVAAVLADAAAYPRVVVSGDMNNHGIGREFLARGYRWPTEHNPHTEHFWNWDHIFLKGLALSDSGATGVVHDNHHASDHRPVWAVVSLSTSTPAVPDAAAP
jgi:endonuclease/exonuclease/phosphatase family metal-dependent hydrolase